MAKKKAKVYEAWIAVPNGSPYRLNAGYWMGSTRGMVQDDINQRSAQPDQWVVRRVRITPVEAKKKARK